MLQALHHDLPQLLGLRAGNQAARVGEERERAELHGAFDVLQRLARPPALYEGLKTQGGGSVGRPGEGGAIAV